MVAELIVSCRITDPGLLEDACRGHVRIVRWSGKFSLEWSMGAEPPSLGHGVIRFQVTKAAVQLVGILQSASTLYHSIKSNVSTLLRPLLDSMRLGQTRSIREMADELCQTVDALNFLELPGNAAAARGGRIHSAALSWPDWTRAIDGGFHVPDDDRVDADSAELDVSTITIAAPFSAKHSEHSRASARAFNRAIRKVLNSMKVGGVHGRPTADQRRAMKRAIAGLCTENEQVVSSAVLCVGRWCEVLFDRRVGSEMLRLSSIARYFAALSHRFEALAHDIDLRDFDEEDLTDLYQDIVEMQGTDRPSYVLNRLREFHRSTARGAGLSEPDWSELVVQDVGLGIAPGFIDEAAYLRAFARTQQLQGPHLARSAGLFLLLGYRFGLRKGELAGLRVKDLVGEIGVMHVIVERLRKRDLKSKRGRRVVPQLFDFTETERAFVEGVLLQARERAKTDRNALLLADPANAARIVNADKAASIVSTVLKEATGNVNLTGHHLRHSFACEVWEALESPVATEDDTLVAARQFRVRQILVGEQAVGRRAPWALASVLGHTHPARAYKSYVHFLCDLGDRLIFGSDSAGINHQAANLRHIVDLDSAPKRIPEVVTASPNSATAAPPNIEVIILGLRMLSDSVPVPKIASSLGAKEDWLNSAEAILRAVNARLGEPPKAISKRYAKLATDGLLSHILRSGNARLRQQLTQAESSWLGQEASLPILSSDEFCGMIGYRRQFSLWLEPQFAFMGMLVQSLGILRGRLTLIQPKDLHDSIREVARKTGWIADAETSSAPTQTATDTLLPLTPLIGGKQEPTRFGLLGVLHHHRFSLELDIQEGRGVGNRLELIYAAICLAAWIQARKRIPQP